MLCWNYFQRLQIYNYFMISIKRFDRKYIQNRCNFFSQNFINNPSTISLLSRSLAFLFSVFLSKSQSNSIKLNLAKSRLIPFNLAQSRSTIALFSNPLSPSRPIRPIRPTCPTRPTGPPRPPSTLILLPPNLRPPVKRWKCDVFTTGRDSRRN